MKIKLQLLFALLYFSMTGMTAQAGVVKSDSLQTLLQEFSAQENEVLERYINFKKFDGVIPSKAVSELLADPKGGGSVSELMLKFLPLASHFALPVTSNFYVGAVAQGESGALYLGSNLEIKNEDLGNSIHAEQSAINNALLHDERGITRIAITAAPCGHCRQFINEIKDASQIEIIVLGNEPTNLKTLLPHSFGPVNLGSTTPLFVENEANQNLCATADTDAEPNCSHSYAPHTGSPSAVILKVSEDTSVAGVYIENAAYNPSLSPLMSALDQLKYLQSDFSLIKEATLFELSGSKISQRTHVESLLKVIAPEASFKVVKIPVEQTDK